MVPKNPMEAAIGATGPGAIFKLATSIVNVLRATDKPITPPAYNKADLEAMKLYAPKTTTATTTIGGKSTLTVNNTFNNLQNVDTLELAQIIRETMTENQR